MCSLSSSGVNYYLLEKERQSQYEKSRVAGKITKSLCIPKNQLSGSSNREIVRECIKKMERGLEGTLFSKEQLSYLLSFYPEAMLRRSDEGTLYVSK